MNAIMRMGKASVKTIAKAVVPQPMRKWIRRQQTQRRDRQLFQCSLRPTDVFLVGHPKSGNTWLAYMLAAAMEKKFGKKVTMANVREFIPACHANDRRIASYAQFPDPRIFRNEGPLYPELYPKTIYLVRDPRAVLVSYYHHCVHDTGDFDWPFKDFVDEMLAHGHVRDIERHLVRWDTQVLQWLERSKLLSVKIVKYEDMIEDREEVLRDIMKFIGLVCDEKDIALAVERGSFENMRKEEELYGAEPYSGTKGERGYYVRRGKVDGWKDEISPELVKRIETEFSEAMKKVGYL
jgi:Sulfotransferase domain